MQTLAAQIEEAVFEARILGIFEIAEHRQRQLGGHRFDLDLLDADLDLTGRKLAVDRVITARHDRAGDRHHPFRAAAIRIGECGGIRLHHALGDAVMVAQVQEHQPAMVAAAIDPARQPDALSDGILAQLATIMGAIGVHAGSLRKGRYVTVSGDAVKPGGGAGGGVLSVTFGRYGAGTKGGS